MVPPPTKDEHDCAWQAYAKHLQEQMETLRQEVAALRKHVVGPQSEKRKSGKMPPAVATKPGKASTEGKRRANRELRESKLETEVVPVPVPDDQRACPKCGDDALRAVGAGKPSVVYQYVAPHFRKIVYRRETLACSCGGHMVTAPGPDRVGDKTRYAASFIAHVVVTKCADSRAQYNLAKEYQRVGIPIARSTINALFHRAAAQVAPLVKRLFERIAASYLVLADETSMRMQDTQKKAFLWTFLTDNLVGYRFAVNRSGDTPVNVLGDSDGMLLCDAYTGYNRLTSTGHRLRAGCLAHARRKIFDAREYPEAEEGLALVSEIYAVEHDAKERKLVGTATHAAMRRDRARLPFAKLLLWARRQRRGHGPKSLLGRAGRYIVRNFRELGRFLGNERLPPDNNASESALRRVAMGRRTFLFVGYKQAGERLADLYSLVATCEMNGVNPIAYLTDVLTRIDTHPQKRIDELLPDGWKPP